MTDDEESGNITVIYFIVMLTFALVSLYVVLHSLFLTLNQCHKS